MSTTPEENEATTPVTKPRRRRAASRPAGPPAPTVPPTSQQEPPPAPAVPEATPAALPELAAGEPVSAAGEAPAPPERRTRRATRKTAEPAPTVAEPETALAPQEPATAALDAPAEPAAEAAPPRRRRSRSKVTAAAPAPETSTETSTETAADVPLVVEPAGAAPGATPAEVLEDVVATEPAAAQEPARATTAVAQPDLMDDPVLVRAGLARADREPTGAERAADAAARATALFFQAPDVDTSARRSRRASAPAGPPPSAVDRVEEPRRGSHRDEHPVEDTDDESATDVPDDFVGDLDAVVAGAVVAGAVVEDVEDEDDVEDDDFDEADAPRRRRRRGGRGRRSRTREAGDPTDDPTSPADDEEVRQQPAARDTRAEDEEPAEDEVDEEPEDGDGSEGVEDSGGSSRRRRRRRRRGGAAEAEEPSPDDPPNTVVRVREPRRTRERGTGDDEITALKGSTRLEAKKQRRREGREQGRKRAILTEAEFLARRESVERVMVIRERDDTTQIGVLEDGILVEHYGARQTQTTMVGNVYLGRVQNVLPSMEAAFVDVGKGRNAVLYAGEVNWDAAGLEGQPRRIEAALKSGDPVLVQVTKDPVGHKGARLTSQVSLPGRYLVYVPRGSMTGISRKLPDTERTRLKKVLKKVVPEGAGVIVRTAAEGVAEEELAADVQRLQATWEAIQAKADSKGAPVLLHGEPDLTVRVVRDVFNEDFTKLVVAGQGAWETVHDYVADVAPDLVERLERWSSEEDAFAAHRVEEQLQKALGRKVYLPSGGSLVIDPTEAMHVVDVNTGKFTGSGGTLEETVTRNNLEAAEEIVRQLRLRDIGGIIVIDFIDMVLESNRDLVLRRLVECLGRDRTKHQVAEVTSLGLVQMTRKRTGQGLAAVLEELEADAPAAPRGAAPSTSPGGSGPASANGAGTPAPNGSDGGSTPNGKSRSRRSRSGARDARPVEVEVAEAPATPAAKEPAKDAAVLAAIAAVAAAGRKEAAAAAAAGSAPQDHPAGEPAGEQ